LNRRLGGLAWIRAAAACQPADRTHNHVVIADDLTRQPDAYETAFFEARLLGHRHPRRFTVDELDTAGRAARVPAARVQDVDMRILLDRKDEALAIFNVNRGKAFDGQSRHEVAMLTYRSIPSWPTPHSFPIFLVHRSSGSN
jgi:hypothetical protein